ncbi:bifunctional protein FolD 4, chloroplastic [Hordeum vulgare]|nr:bifunctional protein FolD 4, chloroplastic [Hordeum vulgare]
MASSILSDCSSCATSRLLPLRRALHPPPPRFRPSPATVLADASAKIIDGKLVAKQIREEVGVEIARMKDATGVVPGWRSILVGSRKDSQTYVRNKKKACEAVGISRTRSICRRTLPSTRSSSTLRPSMMTRLSMASWFSCPCLAI